MHNISNFTFMKRRSYKSPSLIHQLLEEAGFVKRDPRLHESVTALEMSILCLLPSLAVSLRTEGNI